jgi:hypothetical protein
MEQESEQFKNEIMRRIEREYFLRTFVRPFVIECALLGGVITGSAFFVSIKTIVTNAYSTESVSDIMRYFWLAFSHTERSVQIMAVAALVLAGLIIRDTIVGIGIGISRAVLRLRAAFHPV